MPTQLAHIVSVLQSLWPCVRLEIQQPPSVEACFGALVICVTGHVMSAAGQTLLTCATIALGLFLHLFFPACTDFGGPAAAGHGMPQVRTSATRDNPECMFFACAGLQNPYWQCTVASGSAAQIP